MNTCAPSRRYDSVQQDWRAFLPEPKASLFRRLTQDLECDYMMLSISLNEMLDHQRAGKPTAACQGYEVLSPLCARLAIRINAVLHGMCQHARHFGVVPNLAPLEAANFRGERCQRSARYSHFLNQLLLSERSQFLNKLNTLEVIVDLIGDEFIVSVSQVRECSTPDVPRLLQTLDCGQYDLNTCLREADVLLKSFLIVLPEDQVANFDFTVNGLARARRPVPAAAGVLHTGRITLAAGQ